MPNMAETDTYAMTNILAEKRARKVAEEDALRLYNRVRQLQKEEDKAEKRISDTKRKAKEIVKLRERNELLRQEKEQRMGELAELVESQRLENLRTKDESTRAKTEMENKLYAEKVQVVQQTKEERAELERWVTCPPWEWGRASCARKRAHLGRGGSGAHVLSDHFTCLSHHLHASGAPEEPRDAVLADEAHALAARARAKNLGRHHVQHDGHPLARPPVHERAPLAALALPARRRRVHHDKRPPRRKQLASLGPVAEVERPVAHAVGAQVENPAQASGRAVAGLRGVVWEGFQPA